MLFEWLINVTFNDYIDLLIHFIVDWFNAFDHHCFESNFIRNNNGIAVQKTSLLLLAALEIECKYTQCNVYSIENERKQTLDFSRHEEGLNTKLLYLTSFEQKNKTISFMIWLYRTKNHQKFPFTNSTTNRWILCLHFSNDEYNLKRIYHVFE